MRIAFESADQLLVDLACVAAWLLALVPAVLYLVTGWQARRDRLLGALSPAALERYYRQFRQTDRPTGDLKKRFKEQFGVCYGRRLYIVPLLLLGLVTGVGMWGTARTLHVWLGFTTNRATFPPIAISAFLGAFTWVIGDQLARLRTQDFTPDDVYGCAYRILIAVPVGYALTQVTKSDVGVPLAFLLGVFPTGTLRTISRRLAAQRLGVADAEVTDVKAVTELAELQGIGRAHAERYEEEGINTIVELAWSDPIDVSIRTNFDLWFVVDCVSQALLWVYVGPKLKEIYQYSLRGSMEAQYLLQDLSSTDQAQARVARKALEEAAVKVGMTADSLQHTLTEAARDPYTMFLCDIWGEEVA